MARVVCRTSEGTGVEPVIYGIGFGTDAARGTNPRAFAELDSLGRIIRTSTRGLDISAVRLTDQPSPVFDISVSGEQLAAFDRLPAVYLTAVSTNAPACMMSASAELPSRVLLHVRCLGPVDGLLVGVLY